MQRYRRGKHFCPICYKLYPSDDQNYQLEDDASEAKPKLKNQSKKPAASKKANTIAREENVTPNLEVSVTEDACANDNTTVSAFDSMEMVQCSECLRWVHAFCEGIDQGQFEAMTKGTHPVWVSFHKTLKLLILVYQIGRRVFVSSVPS